METAKEKIQAILDTYDAQEGVIPELLDLVDLELSYSPVIAIRGEGLENAVEVVKTQGGTYLVRHGMFPHPVEPESLKRMRLRYLLALKKEQTQKLGRFYKQRQE